MTPILVSGLSFVDQNGTSGYNVPINITSSNGRSCLVLMAKSLQFVKPYTNKSLLNNVTFQDQTFIHAGWFTYNYGSYNDSYDVWYLPSPAPIYSNVKCYYNTYGDASYNNLYLFSNCLGIGNISSANYSGTTTTPSTTLSVSQDSKLLTVATSYQYNISNLGICNPILYPYSYTSVNNAGGLSATLNSGSQTVTHTLTINGSNLYSSLIAAEVLGTKESILLI